MHNRFRPFIYLLLIVALALPALPAPVYAQSGGVTTVTITPASSAVNVRSGPGGEYLVRGTLYAGFILTATGRSDYPTDFACTGSPAHDSDAWLRVVLTENVEGWVNLCVVVVTGTDESLPVAEPQYPELIADAEEIPEVEGDIPEPENPLLVSVTLGVVILRGAPDLGGEVMGRIDDGDTVEMLYRTYFNGWIRVRCRGGVEGWIVSFMVRVSEEQHDALPIFVSISGPIDSIIGNTIIIFDVPITLTDTSGLSVGMVVFIEGISPPGDAISITIVQVIVVVSTPAPDDGSSDGGSSDDGGSQIGDSNDNCQNGPPPWAPAHGWRRRCESHDDD